jgi:glycosyltransferase involved in cell wall biosynthesis
LAGCTLKIKGKAILKLSLILPVYNPSDGWADIVLAKTRELAELYPDIDLEALVVNDGSTNSDFIDGKSKIQASNVKLIEYSPNKGKGAALRTGVRESTGDIVIYTDIDFPYTIESISGLINILNSKEADIVIGVKDKSYYAHVPWLRKIISILFRSFIRMLFRIPTDDTQCGLKGFDSIGKDIFLKTTINRYLFDLEFISLASRDKKVNIKTQEIKLREDVLFRKVNFGIMRNELGNFLKILMYTYTAK